MLGGYTPKSYPNGSGLVAAIAPQNFQLDLSGLLVPVLPDRSGCAGWGGNHNRLYAQLPCPLFDYANYQISWPGLRILPVLASKPRGGAWQNTTLPCLVQESIRARKIIRCHIYKFHLRDLHSGQASLTATAVGPLVRVF